MREILKQLAQTTEVPAFSTNAFVEVPTSQHQHPRYDTQKISKSDTRRNTSTGTPPGATHVRRTRTQQESLPQEKQAEVKPL